MDFGEEIPAGSAAGGVQDEGNLRDALVDHDYMRHAQEVRYWLWDCDGLVWHVSVKSV